MFLFFRREREEGDGFNVNGETEIMGAVEQVFALEITFISASRSSCDFSALFGGDGETGRRIRSRDSWGPCCSRLILGDTLPRCWDTEPFEFWYWATV